MNKPQEPADTTAALIETVREAHQRLEQTKPYRTNPR